MKQAFVAFALWLTSMTGSWAELGLEVQIVEVKPKPEDEVAATSFVFHNKGSKPVTVLGLESGCSCLKASLDKSVYQPGEKGTGQAEFRVSSFVGRHEKSVRVQTDDPAQPEWVIPFVIDIPAVVSIEPKTLQWWVGDPAEPKTCKVKMLGEQPLHLLNISATRTNVEYSFKEVVPGKEYEVTVRPTTTNEVMLGALKLETDSKIPKYQRQLAFFSVYRKPTAAAAAPPTPQP